MITSKAAAALAVSGGATGIVVEYGSLLVIDPGLIGLGLLGFIVAYVRYIEHTIGNRVTGLIIGILLANFSSLGFAEYVSDKGLTFITPHMAAVFFGFSGSSIIEIVDKYLEKKRGGKTIKDKI